MIETKTVGGKRVIIHGYNKFNSCNNEVTFPLQGNIVLKEKPFKSKYTIWTNDGKNSVLPDSAHWEKNRSQNNIIITDEIQKLIDKG
jgi:hypothetical protein